MSKDYDYPIDYSSYSIDETIILIDFLSYFEDNYKKLDYTLFKTKYNLYRKTLGSIQEEKRINKEFKKLSNLDIFSTARELGL